MSVLELRYAAEMAALSFLLFYKLKGRILKELLSYKVVSLELCRGTQSLMLMERNV